MEVWGGGGESRIEERDTGERLSVDTPKGGRMGESVSAGLDALFLARVAHNM